MVSKVSARYSFTSLSPFHQELWGKGSYLVLVHVDRTPPHLMLAVDGKLFDWSLHGVREGVPLQPLFKRLVEKGSQILAIQLRAIDPSICSRHFNKNKAVSYQTCLDVIVQVMRESYALKDLNATVIFEALAVLQKENLILGMYECNIDATVFSMKRYTRTDVNRTIEELKNDQRNRSQFENT